jgi:hypothetical protein
MGPSGMQELFRWSQQELITYDIFRTFDLRFVFGGWYKQEERDL